MLVRCAAVGGGSDRGGWVKKSCSFGSDIAAPLLCSKNSFYSKSFIFKIVCVLWGLCSVSVIFLFPADKLRGV